MLENEFALVTGASRGIGRAIALELGRRGARVVGSATTGAGAQAIDRDIETDVGKKHFRCIDSDVVGGHRRSQEQKWQARNDARKTCGRWAVQSLPLLIIFRAREARSLPY